MNSEQQVKEKKNNPYYFVYDNLSVNESSSNLPETMLNEFASSSIAGASPALGSYMMDSSLSGGGGDILSSSSIPNANYNTLVAQLSGPSTATTTTTSFTNAMTSATSISNNINNSFSYASTPSNVRNYICRENLSGMIDKDKDKDNEWTVLKTKLNMSPSGGCGDDGGYGGGGVVSSGHAHAHTFAHNNYLNHNFNHNHNYNYHYNCNYNPHHTPKFIHTAVQTDMGGLRNKIILIPCTDYKNEQDVFNLANTTSHAPVPNTIVTNSDSSKYNVKENSPLLSLLPGTFVRERKKQKFKKQKRKTDNNLLLKMESNRACEAIRNSLVESKQAGKRPTIKMGTDSMYRFDLENRTYTHPFKCLLCATSGLESRFTRKSSLRRHVETKHPSCDKNASWIIVQRRPRISKHFRDQWNNKYLMAKKHDEIKFMPSQQQQQQSQSNTKSTMTKSDGHSPSSNSCATGNLPWNQVFPELYLFQNPDMFNQLVSSNETAEAAMKRMEAAKNCEANRPILRSEHITSPSDHREQLRK